MWLRIARILSEIPSASEILVIVGRNTYSIMMHHIMVFMIIKGICYICSILTSFCKEFNQELFHHDINYVYLIGNTENSKWIYLIAGVWIPIIINKVIKDNILKKWKSRR